MKRLFSAKALVAATVALGAVAVVSAAHARTDVILSIGLNAPYGYVQPAPVYAQPQSWYVQPQSWYVQPQSWYVQPQSTYVQPRHYYPQPQVVYYGNERRYERGGPFGDWDRDGIPNRFDRDSRFYDHRARGHGGWGDWDRDGVPNRYDNAPNNPYRH